MVNNTINIVKLYVVINLTNFNITLAIKNRPLMITTAWVISVAESQLDNQGFASANP